MSPEAKRFDSITAIGRDAWNACFSNELEDYDYMLAVDQAHIKGFELCYYTVMDGNKLLAAAPAFFTDYNLVTTADGAVLSVLLGIQRIFPKLLTLKLACLGSFATESCPIGFASDCDNKTRQELFQQLLDYFISDAAHRKTNLLAIKDVNAANKSLLQNILDSQFHGVVGMPSAISPIIFNSVDEYLSLLSSSTRKDMRRKLKRSSEIRIEYRKAIDDVIDDIYAMYIETRNRSDLQFEELTREYFINVMKCPTSICSLYYAGDKLIGANVMLQNGERLLDKFFCMRTQEGQDYNLYFISWFANIKYCIEYKLQYYQSGQAGYETKLRLRSELLDNWMYFYHRKKLVNKLLKVASPLLAFDVPAPSA